MMRGKRGKAFLFAGLGALAGFGYYWFIGCTSGSCPISSNPAFSTIYGGVVGWLVAGATRPDT